MVSCWNLWLVGITCHKRRVMTFSFQVGSISLVKMDIFPMLFSALWIYLTKIRIELLNCSCWYRDVMSAYLIPIKLYFIASPTACSMVEYTAGRYLFQGVFFSLLPHPCFQDACSWGSILVKPLVFLWRIWWLWKIGIQLHKQSLSMPSQNIVPESQIVSSQKTC